MKLKKLLLITLLLMLLNACTNNIAKTKKYFRIETTSANTQNTLKPLALVVKRPKALSILGGRPMVATQEDQSLVQLSNHFWLESPKVLLQDIFKNWAAQHWQSVSYQVPHQQAHEILDSRILAFEKAQGMAKVRIEFLLYDEDNALIFSEEIERMEPINGDGFRAYANATGLAIDFILQQLSERL